MTSEPQNSKLDPIGIALISIFFILLAYAGYISYKSIDWDILKRLEATPLVLPTPIIQSPSATPSAAVK